MGDLHELAKQARDQEAAKIAADENDAANWRAFCAALDDCRISVVLENHPEHAGGLITQEVDDVVDYLRGLTP